MVVMVVPAAKPQIHPTRRVGVIRVVAVTVGVRAVIIRRRSHVARSAEADHDAGGLGLVARKHRGAEADRGHGAEGSSAEPAILRQTEHGRPPFLSARPFRGRSYISKRYSAVFIPSKRNPRRTGGLSSSKQRG